MSSSSRSLLSPLSVSGPLPACDRVGASYVKPVPRAHKSSSLITQLLSRSLTLPPALLLHVSSNPPSSIPPSISILFFFSFSSSSCPCQLGLSQPPPRFDNATPSQLFSVLSKHKGSRGVSIKVFRRPEADRCFGTCFSTPEMPNFCC